MAEQGVSIPQMGMPEESIPRAVVPWPYDDNRSRYLGLRASGFTPREALALIGDHKSTLSRWRDDSRFAELESKLPELRKTLALEYPALEFLRNYRLVLEKDRRVLQESLVKKFQTIVIDGQSKQVPAGMSSQDFQYLLRLRQHYTPQQLQAIEQLFGRPQSGNPLTNWQEFFMTLAREKTGSTVREEVRIGTRQKQPSQLGRIFEENQ